MATMKAVIATRWAGDGTKGNSYRPRVVDDFSIIDYSDLTGQQVDQLPPKPNVFIIMATVEEAILAQIRAANGVLVLWSEDQNEDAILTSLQRTQFSNKLINMGYPDQIVTNNIVAGITRKEAIQVLIRLQRRAERNQ